jgi:uroporphyrinogen-III decarboxylase
MPEEPVKFCYLTEELKITEIAGITVSDFYNDIELMVSAQKKAIKTVSEYLEIEPAGLLFCKGHVKTSEVMGCEIFQPKDNEPFVRKGIINHVSEVKNFKALPPEQNPIVLGMLEKSKKFNILTGIRDTIMFEGPFTVSCFLRGQTQFMIDLLENPGLCEELIIKVTDAAIEWKKFHDREMGITDAEATGLVDDSIVNISPDLFEKIVLPQLMRWYEVFPAPKRHFHCCGNITNFMGLLSRLNLAQYDMFYEMIDARVMKKNFPGAFVSKLVDFRIVRDRDPKTIRGHILKECEAGAQGGNFGLCLEGIRGIGLEKVRIVRDAVAHYNGGTVPAFEKIDGI